MLTNTGGRLLARARRSPERLFSVSAAVLFTLASRSLRAARSSASSASSRASSAVAALTMRASASADTRRIVGSLSLVSDPDTASTARASLLFDSASVAASRTFWLCE
jgi:hypothetical protein